MEGNKILEEFCAGNKEGLARYYGKDERVFALKDAHSLILLDYNFILMQTTRQHRRVQCCNKTGGNLLFSRRPLRAISPGIGDGILSETVCSAQPLQRPKDVT